MHVASILPSYVMWHYSIAFRDITRVWTNFLWFFFNFFSLGLLAKSLFAPWRRIREEKGRGFSIERIAEAIVTNTVMRLVGFVMRLVILIIGTAVFLIVFWVGMVFYLVWALYPVVTVVSFVYGLSTLTGLV